MREEMRNKTDSPWRDGNASLKAMSEEPWVSVTATLSNGSAVTRHPPAADGTSDRGSGIVPGGIAAAVFISFLLALYAILWKCMVTPPRRKEKKKRKRGRVREQKSQVC